MDRNKNLLPQNPGW
ncbi:hypothetical protein [Sphingobacterium sp. CZ-UAM]